MLALLAMFPAFAAPAQAGFLEDLFGGFETPSAAPMDGRAQAARERARRMRMASLAEGAQPKRALFCVKDEKSAKPIDSTQALMRDATLQYGDVVVTDEGVRIFEGGGACPHVISDFRTLAEARNLNVGTRKMLAAIERDIKSKNVDRVDGPIVAADPVVGRRSR